MVKSTRCQSVICALSKEFHWLCLCIHFYSLSLSLSLKFLFLGSGGCGAQTGPLLCWLQALNWWFLTGFVCWETKTRVAVGPINTRTLSLFLSLSANPSPHRPPTQKQERKQLSQPTSVSPWFDGSTDLTLSLSDLSILQLQRQDFSLKKTHTCIYVCISAVFFWLWIFLEF